jgi:hypothetical protein
MGGAGLNVAAKNFQAFTSATRAHMATLGAELAPVFANHGMGAAFGALFAGHHGAVVELRFGLQIQVVATGHVFAA